MEDTGDAALSQPSPRERARHGKPVACPPQSGTPTLEAPPPRVRRHRGGGSEDMRRTRSTLVRALQPRAVPSVVRRLAALAPLGNLLKMQNLGP